MNKINYIFLFLLIIISPVTATQLFFTNPMAIDINLTAYNADADAPSSIIMQEIPKEFLENVSYIDMIKVFVSSGGCNFNYPTCEPPNGKLYFKLYKNIAGIWIYQTGSFWSNTSYIDASLISNSAINMSIEQGYDYGIGFYTDVTNVENGTWHMYASHPIYDVSTGYNIWKTQNSRICTYNAYGVCDPNNIWGYNQEFTADVNTPKVHTVFPETYITVTNGYPDDIGVLYVALYGQTILPTTPTPIPTPPQNPSDPNSTSYGNMDSNSTRSKPYHENSTSNIMNNSLPNSTGLSQMLVSQGYTSNVSGFIDLMRDYMIYYLIFGIITFLYMFLKKGD
jgi:hypothetical protein